MSGDSPLAGQVLPVAIQFHDEVPLTDVIVHVPTTVDWSNAIPSSLSSLLQPEKNNDTNNSGNANKKNFFITLLY